MSHLNLINDFREVVASVFGSWTALQLAIANGPGGLSSQEIVANMIEGVTQLICGNENIDSYEVADMLHEMMDENFQTICEDDSPEEVGGVLCQYYLKCRSGEKHLVDLELNNVKKVASSTSQRMPSRSTNIEVTTNGEIVKCLTNRRGQCKSTDLFQEPRISEANGGTETNDNSGKESDAKPLVLVEDMDVDGGWITVKSKRHT